MMSYIDSVMHSPMPQSELSMVEALTQAEEFWRKLARANQAQDLNPVEPESGPYAPGSYCPLPILPLWKFPFEQSEGQRAASSVS